MSRKAYKIFKYIEPIWTGYDNKLSLRAILAIAFSIDFIRNLSHAFFKWDATRNIADISTVLGVEAGLIVSLLGITAWTNVTHNKIDSNERISTNSITPIDSSVKVQKVDTINVVKETPKPDNPE